MACKALEALILRLYMDGRGKGPVRIDEAKYYLSDLIEEQKKQVLTSASIVKAVAGFYGLPINDVLGRSQSRECALPRQIAMYLCRNLMKMPYMKIGRYFSRNHSTVITSIRQISQSMEKSNKELLGAVACITKQLRMS